MGYARSVSRSGFIVLQGMVIYFSGYLLKLFLNISKYFFIIVFNVSKVTSDKIFLYFDGSTVLVFKVL